MKSGSRGFIQNLFCNFWTLLQVSTNFGNLKQILKFKTIKNDLKSPHSVGPKSDLRLQCSTWWPATRGRPEGRLGHGLAARSSHAHGGCTGEEKRRRGSLWRLDDGGVVGSGRRGGVPVEGSSGEAAASSGRSYG
jgi:hypothetical protein